MTLRRRQRRRTRIEVDTLSRSMGESTEERSSSVSRNSQNESSTASSPPPPLAEQEKNNNNSQLFADDDLEPVECLMCTEEISAYRPAALIQNCQCHLRNSTTTTTTTTRASCCRSCLCQHLKAFGKTRPWVDGGP
mmetsp:Transcript_10990/g.24532  ORF Transcript_10990/g.24532 Transcript_10990/m.24532 type:complete len:136 (-) Transcript_10990:1186-1593(-)